MNRKQNELSRRAEHATGLSRRGFLSSLAAAGAAAALLPGCTPTAGPLTPATTLPTTTGRFRIAAVGVQGKGRGDCAQFSQHPEAIIAAICDVDSVNLAKGKQNYPYARKYADWRQMLATEAKNIDAVSVSTPDHMHAAIAMTAMDLGKHVYVQKPLAHELYEVRQLMLKAREKNVVTQMGTQHHSGVGNRMTTFLVQSGVIGKIKEVHHWTDRPLGRFKWPQGVNISTNTEEPPANLNWELWTGVAPKHGYVVDVYHPFMWRGVIDFGTGALGDMGCHLFDVSVAALQLGAPISVHALELGQTCDNRYPAWEIIRYEFAGTAYTAGQTLPVTWYDGEHHPDRSLMRLGENQTVPPTATLFVGEKGVLLMPDGGGPQLLPREEFRDVKRPVLPTINHYHQWIDAAMGKGQTGCTFDYAAPLTEAVLLGTLCWRFPKQKLVWDSANLRVSNFEPANEYIRRNYRNGWEIQGL